MITTQKSEQKENNVIQLRPSIDESKFYNAEQSIINAKRTKQEYCDEVLEYTLEHTIACIKSFGFFNDSSRMEAKEFVMLEQLLQSILYRYYRLEHPFSHVAEEMITIDDGEDGDEIIDDEIVDDEIGEEGSD